MCRGETNNYFPLFGTIDGDVRIPGTYVSYRWDHLRTYHGYRVDTAVFTPVQPMTRDVQILFIRK